MTNSGTPVSKRQDSAVIAPSLRDYQYAVVEDIRAEFRAGRKRLVAVAPTGSGKTVLFSYMTSRAAERGRRVLILVHRQELIDQVDAMLASFGVRHGIIAAGYPESEAQVQVASVQTLVRRLDRFAGAFDLVVIDEAHHAVAETWRSVLADFPEARVLGVTATPERLDGRGLIDVFESLVIGPSTADLTKLGFLSRAVCYAPQMALDLSGVRTVRGDYDVAQLAEAMSDDGLVGDAVEHYARLAAGRPVIAFCVSIAHSMAVANAFNTARYRAAHIDGETPRRERKALIAGLGKGQIDILCNCGIVSEGLDVPVVGGAILLRPTKSLSMHLQMIGRALRPAPGKTHAIILDHAGNTLRHGLPSDERTWTLDSKRRRPSKQQAPLRRCPFCEAIVPMQSRICPECNAVLVRERDRHEIDVRLVEVEQAALLKQLREMSYPRVLEWADTPDRLRLVARVRGYKNGWVYHQLRDRGLLA